jgi:RimJ/RimL family protein N-acetyltransferase
LYAPHSLHTSDAVPSPASPPPVINALGQPISYAIPNWQSPPFPDPLPIEGRYARVEPLDATRHAASLYAAYAEDRRGAMWTYLGYGPFESEAQYTSWAADRATSRDPSFYAIVDGATNRALGALSYLRIDPPNGTIELGHLAYSPALQRTRISTEALFLLAARAFSLGYRRLEWKCDALNAPSRRAAERFGFLYEGTFRQAVIAKGRNRDTAWYAIIDRDWPRIHTAFGAWLDPGNFGPDGRQRVSLSNLTRAPASP